MQGASLKARLAIAGALALASFLVACGGEDGETSATVSAAPETTVQASPPRTVEAGSAKEKNEGSEQEKPAPQPEQEGADADKVEQPAEPQGLAPSDPGPLPNEGSKTVAPGVPTTKGGDNSIQSYGVEGDSAERVEAATAVQAYLDALVGRRWSEACAYLAAEIRTNLEKLTQQGAPQTAPAERCERAVEGFIGRVRIVPLRTVADVHVLSMRIEGDRGFLIYEDGEGEVIETPLQHEGGQWKVRALIPKDLIAG